MVRIHSVNSDRELVFSKNQDGWFDVEIFGSTLQCSRSVWHDDTYPNADEFFKELASFSKPWQGERIWESIEGDFKLCATCSLTGKVLFSINIRQHTGEDEESNINTGLVIELGQLNNIAESMGELFK